MDKDLNTQIKNEDDSVVINSASDGGADSAISEDGDLQKAIRERDEYLDGWKRAKADLVNYRNDEFKRLQEIARFSSEDILREVIAVLDSFDLGIVSLGEEASSKSAQGMYMIRAQLEDFLKRKGLERISANPGTLFDPSVHEAIASVESDKSSGSIVNEAEKGYMLHGKLLRPARVIVAK